MEHVREILRVQTPNQVPDVPEYVLGVLTVRGQILPGYRSAGVCFSSARWPKNLRTFAARCAKNRAAGWTRPRRSSRAVRIRRWTLRLRNGLRKWLAETNSSSQPLMEALAKARGLNERVSKQLQVKAKHEERGDREAVHACGAEVISGGREAVTALRRFEEQIAQNIQEDQRIIVVDAEGIVLGLVVDHVHEVLNVPKDWWNRLRALHPTAEWNFRAWPS